MTTRAMLLETEFSSIMETASTSLDKAPALLVVEFSHDVSADEIDSFCYQWRRVTRDTPLADVRVLIMRGGVRLTFMAADSTVLAEVGHT